MITNETLTTILQRRSIRSYREVQIKEDELQAILKAGLYAPYAMGQMRHFTVVQNKELLTNLNLAAKETARQMDMAHLKALGSNEKFDCLCGAPTLIIVSGDESSPIPLDADCAAATQNMLLAAKSLGIGSCWVYFVMMAFYSPQGAQLKSELKIPDGYKPYYAAVFGYPKDDTINIPDRNHDLITYIK